MRKHYLILVLCLFSPFVFAAQQKSSGPTIQVRVDASEAPRKIFHAHLEIPVKPGPVTLFYPQWIPGEHGPSGPIVELTGLKLKAAGKDIEWERDRVDLFTFRCMVPEGANTLEASLDYLSPTAIEGFSAGASATTQLTVVSWNQLILYPQGWTHDQILFKPSLKLPDGWKFGTALAIEKESGQTVQFKPVSLYTLIDSPVITGRHFRVIDLSQGTTPRHEMSLAGDTEQSIAMSEKQIEMYRQLVKETHALFGAYHYQQYRFLYAFSDFVTSFGLEHHESSDNRVPERTLHDSDIWRYYGDLLPHELAHSWNGKYRRPADITTSDPQKPMKTDLLWVYEGLTQYLGSMLAARSGIWSDEDYREHVAWIAGYLDHRAGRSWRSLVDTAITAQFLYGSRVEWSDWRRRVDFYDESHLIWLEADAFIRQKTQEKKSLDDFCKRFHGAPGTGPMVKPYTFEDVVSELNAIYPYDWANFFKKRVYLVAPRAPLGGIEAAGWRLVYSDKPNQFLRSIEVTDKVIDLRFSIGIKLKDDGLVQDVTPGLPADEAGIAPGMKLIAVNGRRWTERLLREAVQETKTKGNLELILENADFIKSYNVQYKGGDRYPHLERDSAKADLLQQILQPQAR